jgi:hypothetical protein
LRTLITIAPDQAFPIFTNCIAQAKPRIDAALKALADVGPYKALPILLTRLQSPDIKIQRETFGLLRHYPMNPQIDSAMQMIATGSNPDLVPDAKGFLTDQYESNHPDALLFSDEPICNGKRLGEWLGMRVEGGGDFNPAAKEAIHQAGTNAIPALLKRLTYVRPPYCFSPFQINMNAAGGFIMLGEGFLIYIISRLVPPTKQNLPTASLFRCWLVSLAGNACSLVAFPFLTNLYDFISRH